ncbi:MAG: 2-oxo acid dehydrogenase subunit E2 [Sedimenticola sp.]|nr:2-oxo acid dehydrogenase subunit E2 [Sedimenticola sp.]
MSRQVDIVVPASEQQGTSHVVANWLVQPGEKVQADAPLVDLETDKVMVEVAAPASGILKTVCKQPGDTVEPGTLLGRIECDGESTLTTTPAAQATPDPAPNTPARQIERALLSPAVRRLVKQHRIDLGQISGSGKRGRVTKQDVLAYLQQSAEGEKARPLAGLQEQDRPTPVATASSTHIPHDNMRRKIAQRMSDSLLHTAPHVTSIFEADLSAIMQHRKRHRESFREQGVSLTLTAYFVSAAARALQWEPKVNSRFHADSLELFSEINIGIGTALEGQGLIVPVIQQAQKRNLLGIAAELQRLTESARTGRLSPADLQGGTFTISNHGVSGSLVATPIIINQPQSAILGVGKIEKRAVVRELEGDDVIAVRPMAYITLTIDHRALDAYQANRFLGRFVEVLEQWNSGQEDND